MYPTIHRLFFALRPDAIVMGEIERAAETVKGAQLIRGTWLKAPKFHLTLHFLGDYATLPTEVIERAKVAAADVKSVAFEFSLNRAASFRGRRQSPCVLRCAPAADVALQSFWRELGDAAIAAGLGEHLERRFTPHVTIAYGDKELPEPIMISPIVWPVREFVLIDSHVGQSNHEILDHWPLTVQPAIAAL